MHSLYVFYDNGVDKIKDCKVIIGVDGCKVKDGDKPAANINTESNIFGVIVADDRTYDITERFAIDGTVYKPERVFTSDGSRMTILVEE